MSMMGGACSAQRQRGNWRQNADYNGHQGPNDGGSGKQGFRRAVRHSVVTQVPDGSIRSLYPVEDNYIMISDQTRSPKTLFDLCTDSLCRSLPNLDGELPAGLPQDVVDSIVKSLIQHAALNATTLRILRNCEIGALSLAGCRGVTDDWLEPLSTRSASSSPQMSTPSPYYDGMEPMDLEEEMNAAEAIDVAAVAYNEASSSSCSTSSFVSASSFPFETSLPTKSDTPLADDQKPTAIPSAQSPPTLPFDFTMNSTDIPSLAYSPVASSLTFLDLRGSQNLSDKGLMQLSDLRSLEVVKLDNCHSLVGRGMVAFAASHRLHTLSLVNCRRLTDEGVINVSHLSSIESLALDGCRCITDRSLVAISNLFNLRRLDLSQCDLLTDEGIDQLHYLELLEELSLGWCRSISDRAIETLTQQPGRSSMLRVLRLARCPITDEGVAHLGRLAGLEELDLNGCTSIGSAKLGETLSLLQQLTTLDASYCPGILRNSWQGKIKSLKSLELCYSGVRDVHLSRLVDLPALEELNFDSCPIGDWAIAHLADGEVVPNLKSLDLADTDLSDLGMVHVSKFKKLERLSLFYCNITNSGLRHLMAMTTLQVLNLDSREISDDGMFYLRSLTNLKSLDIFSGRITDIGCAHISKIKSLESLELCGGGVGDLGCSILASLENLTSLNLSQNDRISNRGAAGLAALTNLKALNLSNTRVNASALRFFSGLLKLQSLALYGCPGIEQGDGLAKLQSGLPSLKCLRLNSTSDHDGTILPERTSGQSDDDDDTIPYHPLASARSLSIDSAEDIHAMIGMVAEDDDSIFSDDE